MDQTQATSDSPHVLHAEEKKFADYGGGFADMLEPYIGSVDWEMAASLTQVANRNVERLGLLASLVALYEGTTCSERHSQYHIEGDQRISSRQTMLTSILNPSKPILPIPPNPGSPQKR
jgi:hypothetical protein